MIMNYEYAGLELRKGEGDRGGNGPLHAVIGEKRQQRAVRN